VAKKSTKSASVIEFRPAQAAAAQVPAPLPLSAVLGQGQAVQILRSAMASGRLHHAWIFHGPPGVGKFTTALAFAAVLLDPALQRTLSGEMEPDPQSPTQRLLAAGTHPDLRVITKELGRYSREPAVRQQKQTVIANEVIEEFLLEPAVRTGGGTAAGASGSKGAARAGALSGKVFIVDEAELLAPRSQNTLLKTLEEPPPGTVIILVTSNEDRLVPTIRSRCQRVAFTPLSDTDMSAWLKARRPDLERQERDWLVRFAAGSPGVFLSAHEGGLYAWHRSIEPMLAALETGKFPLDLGATMAKLVDEWAVAWVEAHENASKEAATKSGARKMFALVAEHYRSALRDAADKPDSPRTALALRAIELVREAEQQADTNVNLIMVMDNLAAQLAV
jgi:DNA polymerase III subunit delta'